ncbi:hypothetical protein [Hymenobacter lapidiphilus]|uniref:Uncharacterized protein n=1 Tax=Hymenobacter lapidiphilus TaxID=2608003 RepID=A0A7Y7PKY7_9BACT|nr:hypothetical protein [Hymenobacter lapidiphilus]NVO29721.1 hypothetical protein [Hymenobacter lapidiphilus]
MPKSFSETPTLQGLIRSLGNKTDIVGKAQQILADQGHAFARSTIYSTIQRNGSNNAVIEAALLDAVAAEKKQRADLDARRQALSE